MLGRKVQLFEKVKNILLNGQIWCLAENLDICVKLNCLWGPMQNKEMWVKIS
jgi:hypothetical protein